MIDIVVLGDGLGTVGGAPLICAVAAPESISKMLCFPEMAFHFNIKTLCPINTSGETGICRRIVCFGRFVSSRLCGS